MAQADLDGCLVGSDVEAGTDRGQRQQRQGGDDRLAGQRQAEGDEEKEGERDQARGPGELSVPLLASRGTLLAPGRATTLGVGDLAQGLLSQFALQALAPGDQVRVVAGDLRFEPALEDGDLIDRPGDL